MILDDSTSTIATQVRFNEKTTRNRSRRFSRSGITCYAPFLLRPLLLLFAFTFQVA